MRSFALVVVLVLTARTALADDGVAFGESGLRVGQAVLVSAPVDGAAYDPAMDLVWFETKGTLQVIDLRDAKHKAIVIAKKFPAVGFQIDGPSKAEFNTAYTAAYAAITLGKKVKIAAEDGAYAPVDPASTAKLKKSIKKAKVVGQKWLKGLAKRTARSITIPTPSAGEKVKLGPDVCQSDDPDSCGNATSFDTTAYQLVESQYSCGDACYTGCLLYDPKAKKFASPLKTSAWGKDADAEPGECFEYYFDSDGKSYVSGPAHCTIDVSRGVTCTDDTPWTYVGLAPKS